MPKKQSYIADLIGISRLSIVAVAGVTDLVQEVHMHILQKSVGRGTAIVAPVAKLTRFAYRSVHSVNRLVGYGIERVLAPLVPLLGEQQHWSGREALLAAVNGVLGDHLAHTNNPLATQMQLRFAGQPIDYKQSDLGVQPAQNISGKILILLHGLCMNDLQWRHNGVDHGETLALERGYTRLYLHYNSGCHISSNGQQFAACLQTMLENWPVPVEEIVLLGHSMGGLVSRSACHYAAQAQMPWLGKLRKMVFLGSPHQGAPLERSGNWVNILAELTPYSAPFAKIAKIRSAGITDLRHGSLLDSDWQQQDRFAHRHDLPAHLPLPENVACFAIAATLGKQAGDIADRMLAGDGLVPLASALGQHPDPARQLSFAPEHSAIVYQTSHLALLNSPLVTQLLLAWL